MRTEASRRGQAMIEMAIGMLVFMLILGGLISFGSLIPKLMEYQSEARFQAGSGAQGSEDQENTSGNAVGEPLPFVGAVLDEPEVRPVSVPGPFVEASTRPFEFFSHLCDFSIPIDVVPGTVDWIWGGETSFHGVEGCHMPIMKIPEFSVGEEDTP